jgi:hypothetical protein
VQHELFKSRVEVQDVRPRAVVAREVARLEPRLAAVLGDETDAAHLQADEHDLFASPADAHRRTPDDLTFGVHGGKMQTIAFGSRNLAEKRRGAASLAVKLDERIADGVPPKLKALAFRDVGRCQHGFHYTAFA